MTPPVLRVYITIVCYQYQEPDICTILLTELQTYLNFTTLHKFYV
jgi:hypothetical protein